MRTGLFPLTLFVALLVGACSTSPETTQGPEIQGESSSSGGPSDSPTDPITQACLNGIARSCLTAAGSATSAGRLRDARDLYAKGCELKEALGCLYAGQMWAETEPRNLESALELMSRGCELGEPTSCYGGGLVAAGLFGGDANPERAAELHRKGCNQNLADSCTSLGEMLLTGQGVAKDESRGLELLNMACSAEEGGACILLGAQQTDSAVARRFYEQACGFGDGQGCTLVALGEEGDSEKQGWFEKGCVAEIPDPTSCTFSALPSFNGDSPDKAVAIFRQTCEFGDAMGCFFLALAHRDGRGVKRAPELASELLERACESDAEQCARFRKEFDTVPGS